MLKFNFYFFYKNMNIHLQELMHFRDQNERIS